MIMINIRGSEPNYPATTILIATAVPVHGIELQPISLCKAILTIKHTVAEGLERNRTSKSCDHCRRFHRHLTMGFTQNAIIWPTKYTPGTTDNFVSNETIVLGLSALEIWPLLADISKWESYYSNVSQITPPPSSPLLNKGDTFSFSTFGFPPLSCRCEESVKPGQAGDGAGRLAWSAGQEGGEEERLDVYHAWIVEDLEGGRLRILTQESQIGVPARELAGKRPNPMLNGHQEWLDGLVGAARRARK